MPSFYDREQITNLFICQEKKNNNPSENMTFRLKCDKKFEIEKVKYSNCANTNIPIRIRKKYEFNLRLHSSLVSVFGLNAASTYDS